MIGSGEQIRWGILGAAKIARQKVIPAIRNAARCEVHAIASRDVDRARRTALQLGIPKAFGDYAALLTDAEIDVVYIPLPNQLHVPLALEAIAAGKHVLCEKPLALDAAEAQQLADAAALHPELKVAEGWMYRHHPQWIRTRQLVSDGAIGRPDAIVTHFSYFNEDPDNIRNRAETGGGALMDIGCYPVSLSRFLLGREPESVMAVQRTDQRFGVDTTTSALMTFGDVSSSFVCSTRQQPFQRVQLFGDLGMIEIEIPFNAPPDRETRIWLQRRGSEREEIRFPVCDQYQLQAEAMADAILNGTELSFPISDGVANMRVLDAIVRSSHSGQREIVPDR